MITRLPDLTTIYTEEAHQAFTGTQGALADARFTLTLKDDLLLAELTAEQTPLCYLRLRWHFTPEEKRTEPVRIYGDAWERGGGNLEWRGVVPERCMPWFFLVSNGTDASQQRAGRLTEGFGVKARPGAMCMWQYDTAGATLWLDVRNGGSGVVLGGRTLQAAEVIFRAYENCTAFEAGSRFCREMCSDGLTTPSPVYGSNNWYYAYGNSSQREIEEDTRIVASL